VLAERDGLASSVHAVVELKSESPTRPHEHIHAIPVRDLVGFTLDLRCLGAVSLSMSLPAKKEARQGAFGLLLKDLAL
jgi:hypothetical protein